MIFRTVGTKRNWRIHPKLELGAPLGYAQRPRSTALNLLLASRVSRIRIKSSKDAFHQLQHLPWAEVEEAWVLTLHSNKTLIGCEMAARGSVDHCIIHPRDVFRSACRANASGVVVAHNHPSGDSAPSTEDVDMTLRLLSAAEILGIELIDHIVIGRYDYFSFSDTGWNLLNRQDSCAEAYP